MNLDIIHAAAANPLIRWEGMLSPPQREFHQSLARKRFFRAANKIGKSASGAAESWWHLLGTHPWRPSRRGTTGLVLVPDLGTFWHTSSLVMRELEPPGVLHHRCFYDDSRGYTFRGRRQIKLSDEYGGGVMLGKGCIQSAMSLEAIRAQWAWVDEVPFKTHWDALRSRLSMDMGSLWVTLTPINRPVEWMRDIISGDGSEPPKEPDWHEVVAELSLATAPHRTQEDIDLQIAEVAEWERPQRIHARWEGVSGGRRIPGFTDGCIHRGDDVPEMIALGVGFDHGEKPGSAVAVLVGWTGDELWILGEWQSTARTSIQTEVEDILKMIKDWGLTPQNITQWMGDVNSAGIAASGASVNDLLMEEIQRQCGHRPSIRKPHKARGSVMSRALMLSSAFQHGKAHVLPGCGSLIKSLRYWAGKDDGLKHPLDALGYIAGEWLSRPGVHAAKVRYR